MAVSSCAEHVSGGKAKRWNCELPALIGPTPLIFHKLLQRPARKLASKQTAAFCAQIYQKTTHRWLCLPTTAYGWTQWSFTAQEIPSVLQVS